MAIEIIYGNPSIAAQLLSMQSSGYRPLRPLLAKTWFINNWPSGHQRSLLGWVTILDALHTFFAWKYDNKENEGEDHGLNILTNGRILTSESHHYSLSQPNVTQLQNLRDLSHLSVIRFEYVMGRCHTAIRLGSDNQTIVTGLEVLRLDNTWNIRSSRQCQ